ncbi:MAG: hypothetical protein V2B18_20260 [Pseudomonadota bacterium]
MVDNPPYSDHPRHRLSTADDHGGRAVEPDIAIELIILGGLASLLAVLIVCEPLYKRYRNWKIKRAFRMRDKKYNLR